MLLDPASEDEAPVAPVRLWLCSVCGLVQLVGPRPDSPRMPHGHGHGPPAGTTAAGVDSWTKTMTRLRPADHPLGIAIDSEETAVRASYSAGDERVGLVMTGHALSHADDPNVLLAAIEAILAPNGLVAIEFHHVLGLAEGQFDVLSHAHRSYLSLHSLDRLLARHGLVCFRANRVREFGGSVRVLARRRTPTDDTHAPSPGLERIREKERNAHLGLAIGYAAVPRHIEQARTALMGFLVQESAEGRTAVGFGAPARGTVLLNVAGIRPAQLQFTVDRSPAKQKRLLPGCRIPVLAPNEIDRIRPDTILVLPWPLAREISGQLDLARKWGARIVVAMPRLKTLQ